MLLEAMDGQMVALRLLPVGVDGERLILLSELLLSHHLATGEEDEVASESMLDGLEPVETRGCCYQK